MANYKGRPRLPVDVRFNDKYIIDEVTDCWEWQAAKNNIGYGMFRWEQGIMRTAHRVSYELFNGPIPYNMCVCHKCDNPSCVNPDHLWLGTIQDNHDDMIQKGRKRYRPKGFKTPMRTCKYCGETRPANIIGRIHDDKCKNKPSSINTISTGMQSP